MKNIKTFNFKKIKIAGAAMTLLALGSCLKDTGPVQDYSQSPALVSFQYKGFSATPMVTSLLPGNDDVVNVEVALNVPSIFRFCMDNYVLGIFTDKYRTKQVGRAAYDPPVGKERELKTDSVDAAELGVNASIA